MPMRIAACAAAILLSMGYATPLLAQQPAAAAQAPALKRTILQKLDVPNSNYETVIALAEASPNADIGQQSHPGQESGYVIRGSGTILVEGKPPLSITAGQSYSLAANTVHDVRTGADGIKLIVVWVLEKGKALETTGK